MTEIPEQVARNRQGVRRVDSQFYEAPGRKQDNLRFLRNTFSVEPEGGTVETRPMGSGLISGHPDGETHGSGYGESGDHRGTWQTAAQGGQPGPGLWLRNGRNAVRDSLTGAAGKQLGRVGAGTGGDTPQAVSLAALGSPLGTGAAWSGTPGTDQVSVTGELRSTDVVGGGDNITEYGVYAEDGTLVARYLSDGAGIPRDSDFEVRLSATFTATGSGAGNATVTDAGVDMVRDTLLGSGGGVGIDTVAWGDGTPSTDPPALGSAVLSKEVAASTATEQLRVSSPQFADEPASQPVTYSEAALFDNRGNIIWISGYVPNAFEKDAGTQFTTVIGFRLK